MRKLESYSEYPFEGVEVGRSLFALFVKTFLERLIAAANPVYAAIIAEIQAAFNIMFGEISKHHQDFTQQLSETKAVKLIRKDFGAKIDDLEDAVRFKFKKKSKVYEEIFPHGVTEYKRASLEDMLIYIEQAEILADKYKDALGTELRDAFTDLKAKFEAERDLQLETIGIVKSIIPTYEQKKENMIQLLYKAMLVILLENYTNPKVMLTFFNQQLIWPKNSGVTDDNGNKPYSLVIPKGSNKVAEISFTADDKFLFTKISGNLMLFYTAANPTDPPPANPMMLPDGDGLEVTGTTLGAPDMKYLIFINKDTNEDGEVEIILL
jgi:hypothetical protein